MGDHNYNDDAPKWQDSRGQIFKELKRTVLYMAEPKAPGTFWSGGEAHKTLQPFANHLARKELSASDR
jgi:hypothetical protein